ncbi:GAF and ANTAR domain-containing protein [Parafrankia sp. FMc6]|uniref:GAF and ANTAR domain-containing protein n=1 Tax=Parafrankia soli TaxID=2599596 RepID=UPI0034D736A0
MTEQPQSRADQPDLAAAYVELTALLLSTADVVGFLEQLAVLAADVVVPPASCGITLRRDHQPYTVATSDELAEQLDEVQYGGGQGPCLDALRTGTVIEVTDMAAEIRWGTFPGHALAHGVRGSLSLPLFQHSASIGALNLYFRHPCVLTNAERHRAEGFARQATIALNVVLRHAEQATLSDQLRRALSSRAVIDQAIGILMAQQRCTAEDAFAILRQTSQNSNRKLRDVAAALIKAVTGQPPQPPPGFIDPR